MKSNKDDDAVGMQSSTDKEGVKDRGKMWKAKWQGCWKSYTIWSATML